MAANSEPVGGGAMTELISQPLFNLIEGDLNGRRITADLNLVVPGCFFWLNEKDNFTGALRRINMILARILAQGDDAEFGCWNRERCTAFRACINQLERVQGTNQLGDEQLKLVQRRITMVGTVARGMESLTKFERNGLYLECGSLFRFKRRAGRAWLVRFEGERECETIYCLNEGVSVGRSRAKSRLCQTEEEVIRAVKRAFLPQQRVIRKIRSHPFFSKENSMTPLKYPSVPFRIEEEKERGLFVLYSLILCKNNVGGSSSLRKRYCFTVEETGSLSFLLGRGLFWEVGSFEAAVDALVPDLEAYRQIVESRWFSPERLSSFPVDDVRCSVNITLDRQGFAINLHYLRSPPVSASLLIRKGEFHSPYLGISSGAIEEVGVGAERIRRVALHWEGRINTFSLDLLRVAEMHRKGLVEVPDELLNPEDGSLCIRPGWDRDGARLDVPMMYRPYSLGYQPDWNWLIKLRVFVRSLDIEPAYVLLKRVRESTVRRADAPEFEAIFCALEERQALFNCSGLPAPELTPAAKGDVEESQGLLFHHIDPVDSWSYIYLQLLAFHAISEHAATGLLLNDGGRYSSNYGLKLLAAAGGFPCHGESPDVVPLVTELIPLTLRAFQRALDNGEVDAFFFECFDRANICLEARLYPLCNYVSQEEQLFIPDLEGEGELYRDLGEMLLVFRRIQFQRYAEERGKCYGDYSDLERRGIIDGTAVKAGSSGRSSWEDLYSREKLEGYLAGSEAFVARGYSASQINEALDHLF